MLVDKGTHWPNGIALDPQRRRLYWCDAKGFSISYIELNTKEIKTIFQKASHPYDITIFGKYAYWTDWPRRVTRLNLSGKKNQKEKVVRFVPFYFSIFFLLQLSQNFYLISFNIYLNN